jgi:hypothetical protein
MNSRQVIKSQLNFNHPIQSLSIQGLMYRQILYIDIDYKGFGCRVGCKDMRNELGPKRSERRREIRVGPDTNASWEKGQKGGSQRVMSIVLGSEYAARNTPAHASCNYDKRRKKANYLHTDIRLIDKPFIRLIGRT